MARLAISGNHVVRQAFTLAGNPCVKHLGPNKAPAPKPCHRVLWAAEAADLRPTLCFWNCQGVELSLRLMGDYVADLRPNLSFWDCQGVELSPRPVGGYVADLRPTLSFWNCEVLVCVCVCADFILLHKGDLR